MTTPTIRGVQKAPRRAPSPQENTPTRVIDPPKHSPLRAFSSICEQQGWSVAYIKYPCSCEAFQTSKGANCMVAWRERVMQHRIWCVCQVEKMSEGQMQEVAA